MDLKGKGRDTCQRGGRGKSSMNVFSTLSFKFTFSGKFAEMGGEAIRLAKFFQRVESKPSEAQKTCV